MNSIRTYSAKYKENLNRMSVSRPKTATIPKNVPKESKTIINQYNNFYLDNRSSYTKKEVITASRAYKENMK